MKRAALVIAAVLVLTLGAGVAVRGCGISARRQPAAVEARVAKAAWRFLVPRGYRTMANPVAATPETLRRGLEHWADHCATCHANDGSGDTAIGRGLHPPAPDMRAPGTQGLTDGELFYAIEEGIPWTGMPAWGTGTPDGARQSWELVLFIRHLPRLTAAEIQEMERFNPKSSADLERERDIDDFLKGGRKGGG